MLRLQNKIKVQNKNQVQVSIIPRNIIVYPDKRMWNIKWTNLEQPREIYHSCKLWEWLNITEKKVSFTVSNSGMQIWNSFLPQASILPDPEYLRYSF